MGIPCKAFLIDPSVTAVIEIEWNGDYKSIAPLVGAASTFNTVVFDDAQNTVFVDDEGKLTYPNPYGYFKIEGYHDILAGKGLVLGQNEVGVTTAPSLTVDEVRKMVTFVPTPPPEAVEPRTEIRHFKTMEDLISFLNTMGGETRH